MSSPDKDYADLLARLNAIPSPQPQKRSMTHAQAHAWEFEDLLNANGEAVW